MRIELDKAFSSILLPKFESNLTRLDRRLCHDLCLGVLRKKMLLDAIIDRLAEGKKIDPEIRVVLRLGIYQMAFLDKIPAHAAVNEAVKIAAACGKQKAKGFVNAILRRFDPQKDISFRFTDEIEEISILTSHPKFLIERWIKQFGFEQAKQIAETNNKPLQLQARFTVKTSESTKRCFKNLTTSELLELAERGEIYFQDKASQLVAKAVGLSIDESFLDVCCAPGSKFTLIHFLLAESPRKLFIGGDRSFQRLKTTRKVCERLDVRNYSLVNYDAEKNLPFADESFDVILLDAPCSGTGTIRSNPEIRYFLKESDFLEFQQRQLRMLNEALRVLRMGGRLIYSTCSLEKEENEDVIKKVTGSLFSLRKLMPRGLEQFATEEGFLRTYPHRDEMSGFFIAVLKKN